MNADSSSFSELAAGPKIEPEGKPQPRILFLTRTPLKGGTGGAERSKSIFTALCKAGTVQSIWLRGPEDEVRESPPCEIVDLVELSRLQRRLAKYSGAEFRTIPSVTNAVEKKCKAFQPDVIFCRLLDCIQAAPWRFGPCSIDVDDIPWELPLESQKALAKVYNAIRPFFYRRMLRKFQTVFVTKTSDTGSMKHPRARVLPCISTQEISVQPSCGSRTMLFVGNLMHEPNRRGLVWFVEQVLPLILEQRKDAVLLVAGRYPELSPTGAGVKVLGYVEDLQKVYHEADLVVCPIHQGTGSVVKLSEAAGAGKGIVATGMAARGFAGILRPGVDLLVVDHASEFATACVRLLGDVNYRNALGTSAASQAKISLSQEAMDRIIFQEIQSLWVR